MLRWIEKRGYLNWIIVISIAVTIFYTSSLSFKLTGAAGIFSYFYHFLAFFWLAFFLSLALIKGKRRELMIVAILLAAVYAVSDEFHQLFVLGRNSSFEDFLTDSAGILLANFIYIIRLQKSS